MSNKNPMNEQKQIEYYDRQCIYVNKNIQQIIEIYGGKFVVVYDCRIVDSDDDDLELEKRRQLRHKFDFTLPSSVIKIPKTLEEYAELIEHPLTDHLDSPESKYPDFASSEE